MEPRCHSHEAHFNQGLPFAKVQHQVATLDAQPSNTAGGIMVLVTGALLVSTQSGAGVLSADGSVFVPFRSMLSKSP